MNKTGAIIMVSASCKLDKLWRRGKGGKHGQKSKGRYCVPSNVGADDRTFVIHRLLDDKLRPLADVSWIIGVGLMPFGHGLYADIPNKRTQQVLDLAVYIFLDFLTTKWNLF